MTDFHESLDRALAKQSAVTCECPPCSGRGNDGHGLTHCAECCFGTGVVADLDCPTHGDRVAAARAAAEQAGGAS